MSNMLDKMQQHFRDKLAQDRPAIDTPESLIKYGAPEKLYIRPLTLKRQDRILKHIKDGNIAAAQAQTLIERLVDEEGTGIFRNVEHTELMSSVDSEIIDEIVNRISKAQGLDTIEEAEKN